MCLQTRAARQKGRVGSVRFCFGSGPYATRIQCQGSDDPLALARTFPSALREIKKNQTRWPSTTVLKLDFISH